MRKTTENIKTKNPPKKEYRRGPKKVVGYSFGDKLKGIRKKYGITMRELSKVSGVTVYAICRLENEHDRFPNALHMVPIILGISKLSGKPVEEIVSQLDLPVDKSEAFYSRYHVLKSLFDREEETVFSS